MAITGKWIFTAAMDVAPDKEALFNEVYDQEHIPLITKVPGVISATRKSQPSAADKSATAPAQS